MGLTSQTHKINCYENARVSGGQDPHRVVAPVKKIEDQKKIGLIQNKICSTIPCETHYYGSY
jgi:hypothetical protein